MSAPLAPDLDGERPDDTARVDEIVSFPERRTSLPRNPSMSVETVRCERLRASVRVIGELDLGTAAPLWAVLDGHVEAGRRFLRLDLSQVSFLDATALSGITRVHQRLLELRGTLVLVGVRRPVARVLHMTGLDEVLFVGGSRGDDDLPYALDDLDDLG